MLTRILLLVLLATNFFTAGLTFLLVDFITKNIVYDMDQARRQHFEDIKYYYMRGCVEGTDYPPEYRLPTSNFNEHSVPIYCGQLRDGYENDFTRSMFELGVKKRDN